VVLTRRILRRDVDDVTLQSVCSVGDVTLESMTLKSVHSVVKRASLLESVYSFESRVLRYAFGESAWPW